MSLGPSINLSQLGAELAERAAAAHSGRSTTVINGPTGSLHQLLLALRAGHGLSEHDNPGQATIQVLTGAVTLTAGEDSWSGRGGDVLVIPERSHDLRATEDAVVLLTFVKEKSAHQPPGVRQA